MAQHIIEEAKRCLQCKNALCKKGCPVGTPVNDAVEMLLSGQISDAGNYSLTITHCLLSVHWCVRMKSSVKEAVFLVARAMPSTGVPLNIIFLTTTSTKWTYNLKEILRKKLL